MLHRRKGRETDCDPDGRRNDLYNDGQPVVIPNAVRHEGWDLVNGSFVLHELGSESRNS